MTDLLAAAIRIATPLVFAALGGILSERAGVFAVGLEGMMLTGAFAAVVGAWWSGSDLIGILLALFGGASIALTVAVVAVRFRADNMVTGLTANILAFGLTSYLLRELAGGGGRPIAINLTPLAAWPIPGLSDLPVLGPLLFAQPPLTYLAVLGCLALALFLNRTRLGVAMRATADNQPVARLMGVPVGLVFLLTWALSAAVGALTAVLVASQQGLINITYMDPVLIFAFVAAVLGGLDSLPGALLGGVLVGLVENWLALLLAGHHLGALDVGAPGVRETLIFAAFVVALLLRPQGLLGKALLRQV